MSSITTRKGEKKPILNEFIKGLTPMLVLDWLY